MPSSKAVYRLAATCAVVIAAIGCDRDPLTPTNVAATISPRLTVQPAQSAVHYEPEKAYWDLAAKVPGFGSLSVDSANRLIVYIVDTTQMSAARGAVASWLALNPVRLKTGRVASLPTVIRKGEYDFPHLAYWRDQLTNPQLNFGRYTVV